MKKTMLALISVIMIISAVSCSGIGTPIDSHKDENGIDPGIEWIYDISAYPSYGVERQRQRHYFTYGITTDQIAEYIASLENAGYKCTDSFGTAVSPDSPVPSGKYAGDEAYYYFTSRDGAETIILSYIFQPDGTWNSEIDS